MELSPVPQPICKLDYSERFFELLEPEARSGTRSLDEFDDIPASFIYGFLAAAVLLCAALTAVYVTLSRHRGRKAGIKGYPDLIPDLSEEQRARLREIRAVFLHRVEGIRQDMRLRRSELAELLFAEPPDRPGIYEVAQIIIGRQSELEHEVIEHILEEKELLTPSQKRKFYEIIVEQFSCGGLGLHDVRAGKGNAGPGRTRQKA
jgi:Spy/CpxP family protein refolding chaperone